MTEGQLVGVRTPNLKDSVRVDLISGRLVDFGCCSLSSKGRNMKFLYTLD